MTIITATATKEAQESKLGIAFTRAGVESPLMVKLVREGSLFEETDLRAGMIVGTIQGEEMTWKTPKEAADLLRSAPAGEVEITSEVFIGEITKDDPSAKLGISLKNSTKKPGIFISKVNEEGAFADTELAAGQQVLLINDVPCPNSTKEAISLIKDAESTLTIMAIPVDLVPPSEEEEEEEEVAPVPAEVPTAASASKDDAEEEEPMESAPSADMVEEKKEESPTEETEEDDEPEKELEMKTVDPEADEDEDKGLIDKIFATCIC